MKPFGAIRMRLAIAAVVVGVLTFFLPIIEMNAPIIGKIQWSALNVVSQLYSRSEQGKPSFSNLANGAKRATSEVSQPSPSTSPKETPSVPLGVMLAPFIPLEIVLTYLALLGAIVVVAVRRMQRLLGFFSTVGAVASTVALLSVFMFSNAMQQSMAEEMNKPEMRNNPFAGLGQALMQSMRIDPGIALYLLVVVMAGLFAIWKWDSLDRITLAAEQSSGTTSGR